MAIEVHISEDGEVRRVIRARDSREEQRLLALAARLAPHLDDLAAAVRRQARRAAK
jgi:hypothetical protein